MKKLLFLAVATLLALPAAIQAQSAEMNFFITSAGSGKGANLGGITGADQICSDRAYAVVGGGLTWRAYLSLAAAGGRPAVNARDRIGTGPWFNYGGIRIASNVEEPHGDNNNLNKETALTEKGDMVNGRGDTPNTHDMMTGSQPDGTAFAIAEDRTCGNWTSEAADGAAMLGHHDRQGGGERPTSWNSAHASRGCSQENLVATGGNGLFYCFGLP